MSEELLYYTDYLELDKVLNAQHPKSNNDTDETLFIIISGPQAYAQSIGFSVTPLISFEINFLPNKSVTSTVLPD